MTNNPSTPAGPQRQFEVYTAGNRGERSTVPVLPIDHTALEQAARRVMPPEAFDYVAGGASAEQTVAANRAAFARWRIVPRMLRDVSRRDTGVELFGARLPAPVLLAPIGVQGIVRPQAELEVARAAASAGVPFVLSTVSSHTMEAVSEAAADGARWFQLYWPKDHELAASLVGRAERAGYGAVVVTLDTHTLGWRPRDLQRAYLPFMQGLGIANYTSDPVFCRGLPADDIAGSEAAVRKWVAIAMNPALTWDDLARLRTWTGLPILVKGIQHAGDAAEAVRCGIDGIIVSNHGGRQVDGAVASLDALPSIVAAVEGRIPVLFDSGIRTGSDALKALALGARAVLLGRTYIYALALAGESGVREYLLNYLADLDLAIGLSGCASVADVSREMLTAA